MLTRRAWLQRLVGTISAVSVGDLVASCPTTPRIGFGPFYPGAAIPKLVDLTQGGKAVGDIIYVTGEITDVDCTPLAGATVEMWQCDNKGRYKHERTGQADLDPGFHYFAQAVTNQDGRYSFKTLMPVRYGPTGFARAPHIHFLVRKSGYREVATEMHFAGEAYAEVQASDGILNSVAAEARPTLLAPLLSQAEAAKQIANHDGRTPCRQFNLTLAKTVG